VDGGGLILGRLPMVVVVLVMLGRGRLSASSRRDSHIDGLLLGRGNGLLIRIAGSMSGSLRSGHRSHGDDLVVGRGTAIVLGRRRRTIHGNQMGVVVSRDLGDGRRGGIIGPTSSLAGTKVV